MKWQVSKVLRFQIKFKKMKKEWNIFLTAIMFYTRIPCPSNINHDEQSLNKATRYFPLVGWIVGGFMFVVYILVHYFFSINIAVIISLLSGVLITGAFHEDGFADAFDGFGGGWTKEKILMIMKDSRLGTYGSLALFFLLILKVFILLELMSLTQHVDIFFIILLFVNYHALARLTAISIVFTEQYARDDDSSKAKPIAQKSTWVEVTFAMVFGLIPLLVLSAFNCSWFIILIPLLMLRVSSIRYFNKWLQGYTGDCLGAVEQASEIIILLSYIVLWKFI